MDMSNLPSYMNFLGKADHANVEQLCQASSEARDVINQLTRILVSKAFKLAKENARRLLIFIVVMKLLHEEHAIKETTAAVNAFGEQADFDPKLTSKVRAAAGALRARLQIYYHREGQRDPIKIQIPVGAYVPEILDRRISIGISPFENLNPKKDQDYLCQIMAEELADRLSRSGAIQVQHLVSAPASGYGLRGFLACRKDLLQVSVWLSDYQAGEVIFTRTFEAPRDDLLKLIREIALAIVKELPTPLGADHKTGRIEELVGPAAGGRGD
jgi:TolB-like protein